MDFNEALRKYRDGVFTDADVTRCTRLSERAYRELIKLRAVRTTTEKLGRGRVRMCDATTFKRLAVIASLNQSGFSLAMAGRIAYFFPLDNIYYNVCDPRFILLDNSAAIDPHSGLPPRLKTPKADWFEPDKPATANPSDDWLIEIYDGRFVGSIYPEDTEPWIYGDLRSPSQFVAWFPHHETIGHASGRLSAKWQHRWRLADRLDPRFLNYQFEDHYADNDPLRLVAEAAVRSPVVKTSINAGLAVRKALRRYLGVEPAIPDSAIGESQ
jgi:hypothetical protein